MTFLTILEVTEILCSFRLVLEGKTGPEWSRLEFLETFCFIRCRRQHLWVVEKRRYSRFAFAKNTWEPSFWNMMDSCFITISKFGSFKNLFATITSLSELYFRFRRFILLVQTKKVISMNYGSSTRSWKPWTWGLTWYFLWGIYTSIPTWTHSQNSLAAAEALSLKISSYGTSLKRWRSWS